MEHLTLACVILCGPSVRPSRKMQPCVHTTYWGSPGTKAASTAFISKGPAERQAKRSLRWTSASKTESSETKSQMIKGELKAGHSYVWAERQHLDRYFPPAVLSKPQIFQNGHGIGSRHIGHSGLWVVQQFWVQRRCSELSGWFISWVDLAWVSCFQLGSEQKERK